MKNIFTNITLSHISWDQGIDPSSDGDGGDEYLQMNPNTGTSIFSPTRTTTPKKISNEDDDLSDDGNTTTSFTFPDHSSNELKQQHSPTLVNNLDNVNTPSKKRNNKMGTQPEEIPMLQTNIHYSDEEETSPSEKRKNSEMNNRPTPMPRNHVAETKLMGDDNYVNVKPPRKYVNNNINNNNGRTVEAVSNPGYQIIKPAGTQVD